MSNKWLIILGVSIFSVVWILYRGNKIMKNREMILKDATCNIKPEDMIFLVYHGGIPELPKPQKLNLGLSDEYLLFFNDRGEYERIFYQECHNVDKIVTRHVPDTKGKSVVLWGPLIGFLLKVRYRYYIVIEYKDSMDKKNNILLECNQNNHLSLFEKIRNNIRKKTTSFNVKMKVAMQ